MKAITFFMAMVLILAAAGCALEDTDREAAVDGGLEAVSEPTDVEAALEDVPEQPVPSSTLQATETGMPEETAEPTADISTPEPLSGDDMGEIYAAAIHQVYAVEHSFSKPHGSLVYIKTTTVDGTLLDLPATPQQELHPDLRHLIAAELADQPFEIIWVERLDDVPADESGILAEGKGIYISLGNIIPQEDGTVQVPLHMHCGPLCASGKVYVLDQVEGAWQVTGNVGVVIEA